MGGAGIRKPRVVLAVAVVLLSVLGALGLGVEDRLIRSDIGVPGTRSEEARSLTKEHFGESHTLAVLLEGPRRDVARQGRAVAARLDRLPHVSVVGPWSRGMPASLRSGADRALLLVRVDRPFHIVSEEMVPRVRAGVSKAVSSPVESHVTGYADVANGVHRESVEALTRAELIAAPLLMIVLLLVFRSVVAAALPLALGMATIGAARGVIELINRFHSIDVVALNMASMMGLALGVDYALVLVSRFREELAAGLSVREAARVSASTAGRTVLFAGIALGAAMTAALALAPGNLMASSGIGVLTAVALSVLLATVAMPAVLVLLGQRVDKWSFGRRGADGAGAGAGGRWGALALRLIRRPVVAAAVVMGLLIALSAPALALNLGPPDPRNLPPSSPERADFERLGKVLGIGWGAPYEVIVTAPEGERVTSPGMLRRLDAWQSRVARDRNVEAVMGPAVIARGARRLDDVQRGLGSARRSLSRAQRDQDRLARGLARVDDGVGQLRGGLALASSGAGRLSSGASSGAEGAARLGEGISVAEAGAARILSGLAEARAGASELASGGARLSAGARRLRAGLERARRSSAEALPEIRRLREGLATGSDRLAELRQPVQRAEAELAEALKGLEAMLPTSMADPQYAKVYESVATASGAVTGEHPLTGERVDPRYPGLDPALAQASEELSVASAGVGRLEQGSVRLVRGLARLERGADRLVAGIDSLEAGAQRLRSGLRRLERGGGSLRSGLSRLVAGAQRLSDGAAALDGGAARLAGGLSDGTSRTAALSSGVSRMHSGVVAGRARTDKMARRFGGSNGIDTEMFDSGYLPLAALDKAAPGDRTSSTFAVNLDHGGDAARLVVVQDSDPSRAGTPLRERLERYVDDIERATGGRAAVGGPAATLQDFDSAATSRLPLLAIALVLVTYLALVPTLRSLVLPALAVVLNLLTVAAAFGVLAVLFTGSAPLGGAGDLDGIMVLAIFGIVFGLSIDYEVFLLARMREGWQRTGTTSGAVQYGLEKTAGVITGAALIMTGVFVAFALTPIASMRQLGIGLTTAVLLDATLVRLVLLPAAIKLCGRANWWLPGWLDRMLPNVDVEGEAGVQESREGGGSNGSGQNGNGNGNGSNGHRAGEGSPDLRRAIEEARTERVTYTIPSRHVTRVD